MNPISRTYLGIESNWYVIVCYLTGHTVEATMSSVEELGAPAQVFLTPKPKNSWVQASKVTKTKDIFPLKTCCVAV